MLGTLGGARLAMGHSYDDGKPMELSGRIINPQLLRSSSSIRHLLRPDAHVEPAHSRFANSHVRTAPTCSTMPHLPLPRCSTLC